MFCSYCGKEIADDTVFCPYCGRKLGDEAAPAEAPSEQAPVEPAEPVVKAEAPASVTVEAPAPEPVANPAPSVVAAPAPVASAPQPVQSTPPTAGVAPQPNFGQAPASATYTPGAPVAKKKSAIPWIILGTLAAVAVVFGISKIIGSGSGSGSGGAGSTTEPTANGQLLDANGNLTAYALLELDGQELSDCFKDAGYKWNDSNLWWITGDGNNAAWVSGPSEYEFKEDEILELDVNGAGTPAVFAMALDDRNYASVDNVLEAIGNVSVIDSYWPDSEACASVVENSAGRRSVLFVIYDGEDELYRISLVNPEGIDRGILEELTGERGNSLDDIWYSYTGNRLPEAASEPEMPEPAPSEGTHTDPAAAAAVPSGALSAGPYRVGVDIPAGEYKLYATDEWGGYYTVYSKVGSTDYEDIVVINSFDTCAYIHVLDGQQLDVEGAEFIAFENAEPSSEWTGDGVYRVGFDIPAGQYQLVADDGEWGSYYEIRNSVETSDDYYGSSVVFDSFENNKYVNLSDGQYVMLSNCHIEQ